MVPTIAHDVPQRVIGIPDVETIVTKNTTSYLVIHYVTCPHPKLNRHYVDRSYNIIWREK